MKRRAFLGGVGIVSVREQSDDSAKWYRFDWDEVQLKEVKMKEPMKILIAYDGTDCAKAALDDLRRAGLPHRAEITILTVAELWPPVPANFMKLETQAPTYNLELDEDAYNVAEQARERIKGFFPAWDILTEGRAGSAHSIVIKEADEWKPDLIVVGSHGRHVMGRFFLGSVSQSVVREARCSVRVARSNEKETKAPARLIIGVDGSRSADAAVLEVAARHWPKQTEVRIVNAAWTMPPIANAQAVAEVVKWIAQENKRVGEKLESATKKLRAAGLSVSSVVKEDEPKHLLCSEAESWGADCIFVGARGVSDIERLALGSISAAVAARAHCSVEVVRRS